MPPVKKNNKDKKSPVKKKSKSPVNKKSKSPANKNSTETIKCACAGFFLNQKAGHRVEDVVQAVRDSVDLGSQIVLIGGNNAPGVNYAEKIAVELKKAGLGAVPVFLDDRLDDGKT